MEHDIIVINSRGKVGETQSGTLTKKKLTGFRILINNMPLVPNKYIMSQSDFDDIMVWSKENGDI